MLLVAGFNVFYFFGRSEYNYDQSLAAKFLSYHVNLNKQLYAKSNNVKTVIVKPHDSLIATASADQTFLQSTGNGTDGSNPDDNVVLDNALVRPNPDSIKDLIAKQVQIYETQPGDTLASISKHFNISTQTIKWANNLPNNTIKPGWFLLIPPTDGIIVQIKNTNTTLPDIAKKYHANLDEIISYNGLENAEDIPDVGAYLIVKGGRIDPPPAPKKKGGKAYLPNDNSGTDHTFPYGYCTWYVAKKVWVPWGGNAKNWAKNAAAMGRRVDRTPVKGAIFETSESPWGHVGYIESVNNDGTITVSEMNATAGWGKMDIRVLPMSKVKSIIHP